MNIEPRSFPSSSGWRATAWRKFETISPSPIAAPSAARPIAIAPRAASVIVIIDLFLYCDFANLFY
ncbi:unknown protein [Lactococcus lactis subsp. lactis Il1403]|uniref:Uncharacterized protein n=1 Tax=Lactococcus lactis subsp. lactis (strain IL1403) TaxID=272623 RepID=Q9CER5_LACLA|nr:unknown protein [Lactococcus lactis subsp. lactis Il1403]